MLVASFSVLVLLAPQVACAQDYDIVILNGRVMDPETEFDASSTWLFGIRARIEF